jgi:hypothetical protein
MMSDKVEFPFNLLPKKRSTASVYIFIDGGVGRRYSFGRGKGTSIGS